MSNIILINLVIVLINLVIVLIKVNKCLNITSKETGACVLLRAAKPLKGIEVIVISIALFGGNRHHHDCNKAMCELRGRPGLKEWELCKGPGNLCR